MRGLLLLALAGCAVPAPPPNTTPGVPTVDVRPSETGPLVVAWDPPEALWVEIRQTETAEIVWRATAGPNRLGPEGDRLRSPLAVRALGLPPDAVPPDGRGAEAPPAPTLVPGERYTVFVAPCTPAPAPCGAHALQQATFTASP